MKKIEKEFERIRAFIANSRNRAAGFMYYAAVRLKNEEMKRYIVSDTYASVMSKEKLVTKALGQAYPACEFLLKDRALLDFLGLPQKHTEHQLHAGIRENKKTFILELGKDFLWMGDEYSIQVNDKCRRLDLLFYHRALRCLVDVELKAVPFKPAAPVRIVI